MIQEIHVVMKLPYTYVIKEDFNLIFSFFSDSYWLIHGFKWPISSKYRQQLLLTKGDLY